MRVVLLAWIVFSLCINTVYQTFLTSYLIHPGLDKQISSEDEMLKSGIDFGYHPVTQLIHTDLLGKRYERRHLCPDMRECISRTAYKGNMAVMIVKKIADFVLSVQYVNADGLPLLCHMDEIFSSIYYSMLLQKGSPYLSGFDTVIHRLAASGIVEFWWHNIWHEDKLKAIKEADPKSDVIELKHFMSAMLLLSLGYISSVFVCLCEVLSRVTLLKTFFTRLPLKIINDIHR